MINTNVVNVIGGGYAGIESALFLAGHGVTVHLFYKEKNYPCDDDTCCRKMLKKGEELYETILTKELSLLGSPLIRKKESLKGHSTKCIGDILLRHGMELVNENPNIKLFNVNVMEISPSEVTVIATGPQTDEKLYEFLRGKLGSFKCNNSLPIYPIVTDVDEYSISHKRGYEYLLSLSYEQYLTLVEKISQIALKEKRENENFIIYPNTIEDLALHHKEALRQYALTPQKLDEDFIKPYATLSLNKMEEGFILKGFCSALSPKGQEEILRSIKGLEKIKFLRYGGINKGTYVNPKHIVNEYCQSVQFPKLFFAGGILGLGGHLNCIASGLYTALNVYKYLRGQFMVKMGEGSAIGRLIKTLTQNPTTRPRPLIYNDEIFKNIEERDLEEMVLSANEISLNALEKFKEEYRNGKYV